MDSIEPDEEPGTPSIFNRSSDSSTASVRGSKTKTVSGIPRPPGKPRIARGFTKSRLKAGRTAEKYHSSSSEATTACESTQPELEEISPEGHDNRHAEHDQDSPDSYAVGSEDVTSKDEHIEVCPGSGAKSKKKAKIVGGSERSKENGKRSAGAKRGSGREAGRHRTVCPRKAVAEPEESSPPVSSRRLSFVDLSMLEVWQVIHEEVPGVDWMPTFWEVLLTAPYPAVCKPLALRSLGNWVTAYNCWQAMGGWRPEQSPRFFNAYDAQQILGLPLTRVMELLELFNQVDAMDSAETADLQLPVAACMSSCVMLSKVISKRQKIRFLLGIFDEDDNRLIDKGEFVNMLQALFHGAAKMFGIDGSSSSDFYERTEYLASLLFRRILNIYEDQKGEMLDETTSLPQQLVEDWLLGHLDDTLNLPFTLFLERFSVPGQEDDPEIFADEGRRFSLSHFHPVELPLETALSLDPKMLRRHEVIAAEKIFSHCVSMGTFDISHAAAEKVLNGLHMDLVDLWIERLFPALDHLEESRVKMTLSSFLKELCPQATARHLRMFHSWIREYEHLENLKVQIRTSKQIVDAFGASLKKPLLPHGIRQELLCKWSHANSDEEFQDYLCAHCPKDFRALEGDPVVNESLLDILRHHIRQQEEELGRLERLFSPELQTALLPRSRFLKGHVPKAVWQTWNQILDLLDVESEEKFWASCLLPKDVQNLFVGSVTKDSTNGFNRARSLKFFCEVLNYRPLRS